jgi:hypothetical protein
VKKTSSFASLTKTAPEIASYSYSSFIQNSPRFIRMTVTKTIPLA